MDWLNTEVYGNSPLQWALALAVFVGLLLGLRLLKTLLLRGAGKFSRRTETKWDDMIVLALNRTQGLFLFVLALYAGSALLQLPAPFEGLARKAAIIAFLVQLALWLDAFAVALIAHLVQTQTKEDASSVAMVTVIGFIGRVAVWSIMLLMALDNLGFDITALVAGLGIGGIAVALAAQNVLGDLFASVSIVFDQPFMVGDFIVVGRAFGRVRDLMDDRGRRVDEVGPSTPVAISGINEVPDAGDKFYIVKSLKEAEAAIAKIEAPAITTGQRKRSARSTPLSGPWCRCRGSSPPGSSGPSLSHAMPERLPGKCSLRGL